MNDFKIQSIGFLIFEGFPMACLTSMIEPLRAANEISGQGAFSWTLIAETNSKIRSSAGVSFEPDRTLSETSKLDYLILLSSPMGGFENSKSGFGVLRSLSRHGTILGGISGGIFPLVRSGVMSGHSVSVHWCYDAAFKSEFPDVVASNQVIEVSARRCTASGAAAAFDLSLQLIQDRLGSEVATEVACWFQHPLMRGEGVRQSIPTFRQSSTDATLPSVVAKAVAVFAANLAEPISIAEVANDVGVSARQIERSFKKATGQSPSHYYRAMRMNAARQLVMYSKDSMVQIALQVGYGSTTPMVQHYKSAFGRSPQEDRRRINLFRVQDNISLPAV
ncbi:MAG: GlxA family transcriptional regulator [Planktomarina sp.]|nr:GlxA family transcriptional regulator [Planktomarina sp.]